MKRLLFLLSLLIPALLAGQTTPNINLNIPVFGTPFWNVQMNQNFTLLDSLLSCGGARCRYADSFPGADASIQINACIAAVIAAGGGTCNARGLGGTQTISQQINVGNSSFVPVELLTPYQAVWNPTITNGTSCAIMVYSGSYLHGEGTGPSKFAIEALNTTNVDGLVCTDPSPSGGGSYIRISGIAANNRVGGTVVSGAFHIQKLFDNSRIENNNASNYSGVGFYIHNVCCEATFSNNTMNGNGGVGALPLKIGPGVTDVSFYGNSSDNRGSGLNDILIDDGATFTTGPINFFGQHFETLTTGDGSTALWQINSSVGGVNIWGGWGSVRLTAPQTAYCISIGNSVNQNVKISGLRCAGGGGNVNAVNDASPGGLTILTPSSGNGGYLPYYETQGSGATHYFGGPVSLVSGALSIGGNTGLPASTGQTLWMTGGQNSPNKGALYIGDGTGWQFNFNKRTGSTDTTLFQFKDSGNFVSSGDVKSSTLTLGQLFESGTAPSIASGFGTSASVTAANGTAGFAINVGTGGTASQGVLTMPAATNKWVCTGYDATNQTAGGGYYLKEMASTTTTVTLAGFNTAGAQTAWTASDILYVACSAF